MDDFVMMKYYENYDFSLRKYFLDRFEKLQKLGYMSELRLKIIKNILKRNRNFKAIFL